MGLLDDAIREHLELKRRSGADPGEVARAEHEALDPGFADESLTPDSAPASSDGLDEVAAASVAPAGAVRRAQDASFSSLGQDTAELDMLTVLDEQHEPPAASSPTDPVSAAQVRGDLPVDSVEEDSLEWETPAAAPSHEHATESEHDERSASDGGRATSDEPWEAEESQRISAGTDPPGEVPGQERLTFE